MQLNNQTAKTDTNPYFPSFFPKGRRLTTRARVEVGTATAEVIELSSDSSGGQLVIDEGEVPEAGDQAAGAAGGQIEQAAGGQGGALAAGEQPPPPPGDQGDDQAPGEQPQPPPGGQGGDQDAEAPGEQPPPPPGDQGGDQVAQPQEVPVGGAVDVGQGEILADDIGANVGAHVEVVGGAVAPAGEGAPVGEGAPQAPQAPRVGGVGIDLEHPAIAADLNANAAELAAEEDSDADDEEEERDPATGAPRTDQQVENDLRAALRNPPRAPVAPPPAAPVVPFYVNQDLAGMTLDEITYNTARKLTAGCNFFVT